MRHLIALSSLLFCLACSDDKSDEAVDSSDSGSTDPTDEDGDGFTSDEDCDDDNSQVHPGATEVCDSVDNNCDGDVDEGVERTWYTDADGDGFGDGDVPVYACDAPDGAVPVGNDCDDADGTAYPGGLELCDEVDNDCDGETDEDSTLVWYADEDGDGYGDAEVSVEGCDAPQDYVTDDTDCDDAHDDAYPGGEELCDGLDNDCDGLFDEGESFDVETFYQDRDEDGFGDPDRPVSACEVPDGYVTDATDCDDLLAGTYPGADEVCDGLDNDCDDAADEDALDALTWHEDGDGDGYGEASVSAEACEAPDGFVADDTDCDDEEAAVFPSNDEVCDGLDNDCDEAVDEDALDALVWYADSDEDGYGDASDTAVSCEAPAGFVHDSADCDDADDAISPAADEVCDGVDNNCDSTVDEDAAVDAGRWYEDRDADGFGDPSRSSVSCEAPAGSVWDDTDCDDLSADVNPDASEVCDDADNDCDGEIDEDAYCNQYFPLSNGSSAVRSYKTIFFDGSSYSEDVIISDYDSGTGDATLNRNLASALSSWIIDERWSCADGVVSMSGFTIESSGIPLLAAEYDTSRPVLPTETDLVEGLTWDYSYAATDASIGALWTAEGTMTIGGWASVDTLAGAGSAAGHPALQLSLIHISEPTRPY